MDDVNVTELRQNLPAYLDTVRRGQRLKVTSRGCVIAEIVLPPPTRVKRMPREPACGEPCSSTTGRWSLSPTPPSGI